MASFVYPSTIGNGKNVVLPILTNYSQQSFMIFSN